MDQTELKKRIELLEQTSQHQAAYILGLSAIVKTLLTSVDLEKASIDQEISRYQLPFGSGSIRTEAGKVVDTLLQKD